MTLKTFFWLALLTAAAILAELQAANVEDWLKSGLLHPDLIPSVREELALTAAQQAQLEQQLETARQQAEPLEKAVKEQQKVLNRLLQDPATTAEAAAAQLGKLIEAEKAVKELQLRALIGVRDVLSPEQLGKAKRLGPQKMAQTRKDPGASASAAAEAAVLAKAARLKTALQTLEVPPTKAMQTRGEEIESLVKKKDFKAADAALDRLIEDARMNELEAEADPVDFSKFEPGSTDIESLKQRYEEAKTAGQEVISLPLLRELLRAKEAFEQAKEAQDVEMVGRILSYVEGKLKKSR